MGFGVQILGIDGLGKGELLPVVERRCTAAGLSVRRVSWQGELAAATAGGRLGEYPYNELERLWLELFPVFFADATVAGRRVEAPRSFAELRGSGLVEHVKKSRITGMRPASPLATGWLEMAGHSLLYHSVVQPLVDEGHVVIQDSLGIKNVLKSLFMAEFSAPEHAAALTAVRAHVRDYFGRVLAPRVGIYLREDPARVLAARKAENIGVFDNYHAFGGDPGQTFLDLQSDCAREYETFARTHDWTIVDVNAASEAAGPASERVTHTILAAAAR
ncbi:hypothetical protein [Streptomyces sp. NPDC060205]|uniref:hypothetical protein n=1 Tax=Streptomyces sp. NPDC060205 TaxID=3347072 RepID=UPI0036477156